MADLPRKNADDLREAARLLVEATVGITDVVEEMHVRIASGPAVLGRPLAEPARRLVPIPYRNVRGVTRLVGKAIEKVLVQLSPLLGDQRPSVERDAVVAVLNGVLGDWLVETGSPLAITMQLHRAPGPLAGRKVVVFVHGSSMTYHQWLWNGHHHGDALARDEGWSPAYLEYNTGLPVLTNGARFAAMLEELAGADEIAIVAHSMGGLVARVACHEAERLGLAWRKKLRTLVMLGTPHLGSPLERGGSIVDALLPLSTYSRPLARLGRIRSAGVTDLRYGLDLPLPEGVACFAVAAGKDRLVPLASAYGAVPEAGRSILEGAGHLDLLGSPEVYETIRAALRLTSRPVAGDSTAAR
ncbi:MAG: hypothetical protein JWP97_3464 [Labilithrix sp.]|nr:hypothetical protein [Labilithrix sp.]